MTTQDAQGELQFRVSVPFAIFEHPPIPAGGLPMANSASAVFERMQGYQKAAAEFMHTIYLDPKNHILDIRHFQGTTDSAAVYPAEVMRGALLTPGCTGMIFVHNHPTGDTDPSLCDREITRELIFAAKTLGFRVLDHVIIGNSSLFYSFADHGLIEDYSLLFLNAKRQP